MNKSTLLLAALLCLNASQAAARPVSYPGGVTAITENNADMNSLYLHYSPTGSYSIGLRADYERADKDMRYVLQMNNLVKRWNNPDSQANFYIKSGVGIADKESGAEPVAYTGIAADWEDRRFFVSYDNKFTAEGGTEDAFKQSARVGVAPYVAEYGAIHTWLMLQVDHAPKDDDKVTVTPLVRLFKDTHLMEVGVSNQGKFLFNFIERF